MLDKIELLTKISNASLGNLSNCQCKNNSGAFEIVIESLLKAVADKGESYTNLQTPSNTMTQNSTISANKVNLSSEDQNISLRIENAISKASESYGVDVNLIRSIIKVESNFNPNVVSKSGAKGLMQLMPENCRDLGVSNPFNIEENIDGGTRHIKEYLDKYNGDVEMALMAYNGGPTRMMRRGVTSIEHIYKMPKETQNYVPKVMKYYRG